MRSFLWERVKKINRSGGLPILGTTFLGEVQAWNNRVLRLADEYLPLREAAKVDAIAGRTSVMVSADKADALLRPLTDSNRRFPPYHGGIPNADVEDAVRVARAPRRVQSSRR
jgi:hypothetical protein